MADVKVNDCSNTGMIDWYIRSIAEWHRARNLVDGSTNQAQLVKLVEEVGELAGNIARGRYIGDDIGDIIVVLVNISERSGVSIQDCLGSAWNDIKDRRGKLIDGVFVKEADQ